MIPKTPQAALDPPPRTFFLGQPVCVIVRSIVDTRVETRSFVTILKDRYVQLADRSRWYHNGYRYGARIDKAHLGKPARYFERHIVPVEEAPPPPAQPPPRPGDVLDDDPSIAAAFTRLLGTSALSKVDLNDWEFNFACDAPGIFTRYGRYTYKQRRKLREIAEKLGVEWR